MILAIDFDGVIHNWQQPKPDRKMGPPMEGAKEAITRLKRDGYHIIIHSCNRAGVIADWMAYYEIPYTSVWQGQGKPVADRYLDNLGVRFTSWASLSPRPEEW